MATTSLSEEMIKNFVKLNQANLVEMFAAEAKGLSEIAGTETIKVPTVI